MTHPRGIGGLIDRLRAEMPPLLPVRVYVRRALVDECQGTTDLRFARGKPSHFVIEIRRSVRAVMKDTLMHEWAHAIAWHQGHETVCDHDPEWALAYSRVYQLLVEP